MRNFSNLKKKSKDRDLISSKIWTSSLARTKAFWIYRMINPNHKTFLISIWKWDLLNRKDATIFLRSKFNSNKFINKVFTNRVKKTSNQIWWVFRVNMIFYYFQLLIQPLLKQILCMIQVTSLLMKLPQ